MRKIKSNNKIIEFIIELIYVAIGAAFIAIGINLFLFPQYCGLFLILSLFFPAFTEFF